MPGIVQVLSSSRGGAASHVLCVCEGLARHGHGPQTVIIPADGGHVDADRVRAAGAEPWVWAGRGALGRLAALRTRLRELNPEVVHAHGSRAAWWTALATPASARFYYSVHGFVTPFHPPLRRRLQLAAERFIAWRARCVIADAHAERSELLRLRVAEPSKVRTLHLGQTFPEAPAPGARAAARQALGWPAGWHLLMVCRFDRPRDFAVVLEALARLPEPHLHLVGSGPLQAEIEAHVRRLGLESRVHLHGLVRDVEPYYLAADAFVLTSWGWEGCPVTVMEAQGYELPVIVSDAGGAREALVPGRSGLLVARRDVDGMEHALRTLLEHPDPEMGRRGREHVLKAFGIERMIDELGRIYRLQGALHVEK